jgi:hypothetical protein
LSNSSFGAVNITLILLGWLNLCHVSLMVQKGLKEAN